MREPRLPYDHVVVELLEAIDSELDSLTPKQRKALRLYVEGANYAEVGRELGCSGTWAKKLIENGSWKIQLGLRKRKRYTHLCFLFGTRDNEPLQPYQIRVIDTKPVPSPKELNQRIERVLQDRRRRKLWEEQEVFGRKHGLGGRMVFYTGKR